MGYPIRKVVHNATVDASGASAAMETWDFEDGEFVAVLEATYVAGSPLDVKLQTSPDGGTTWVDLTGAAFTQVTVTSASEAIVVPNGGTHVRASFTVTGATPDYTVKVTFVGRGAR
jgi:hypothetical protein